MQKSMDERPLIAITTPLLLGTDGHLKMSKSVGNYIGIDDAPADMFGKIMSIPDSLIVNYYTLLTDTPVEEIDAIERGLAERTINPMETKKRLGNLIVSQLNGAEAGAAAQAEFERVFQRREAAVDLMRDVSVGSDLVVSEVHASVPVQPRGEIPVTPIIRRTYSIPHLLQREDIVQSVGEARRLITQGAVTLTRGQKSDRVSAPAISFEEGDVLKVGRHHFLKIHLESDA
ncbi:MAG: hypothetical protein AB7T32_15220 [Dehalococcoidia bacterium]